MFQEVGKEKGTDIIRIRVNPKYYRPTEVEQLQVILSRITNFGEAGYQLELRRRGKYQSFVTKVESIPISKNDESGSSYLGLSRVTS